MEMFMLATERKKLILDYLDQNHTASTQTLCDLTGASLATTRRDLAQLEEKGLLTRTHGGAQKPEQSAAPEKDESNYFQVFSSIKMADDQFECKNAIAQKSIDLIHSGDILFVGAGFTGSLLCRHLNKSDKKGITVVTTNITGALELASNHDIGVFLLGGNIHLGSNHIETLDESIIQNLRKLYFDKLFFTIDGADLEYGYSITNRAQLPLYNYLLQNVKDIYMLLNESKFNKRAFTHLCSLDSIPNVITNGNAPSQYIEYFKEHDVNVYFA